MNQQPDMGPDETFVQWFKIFTAVIGLVMILHKLDTIISIINK